MLMIMFFLEKLNQNLQFYKLKKKKEISHAYICWLHYWILVGQDLSNLKSCQKPTVSIPQTQEFIFKENIFGCK